MSDEVKYTGPTTLAKNTALVKAELGKKLDKTGGTLTGDLTISGAWLNVKSTDTGDGNISVDGSLVAGRGVSVLNGGKSVSLVCTGDNAAKIAGSGNNCARLAVGTPTGDNDAATKKYVDDHSAAGEKYVVESTSISDGEYDAVRKKTKYYLTFNKTNNEIIAALNSGKDIQFKVTLTEGNDSYTTYFSVGYTRVDVFANVPVYMFVGSFDDLDHSVITVYGVTDSDETYRPYLTTTGGILHEPNPDDSDNGKVLAVNKHKWEMKNVGGVEDYLVAITTLSPSAVPTSVDGGIAQFTASCDKTFAEIKGAIDAGKNVLGNYGGNIWPLSRATDTMIAIDGTINLGYFGDTSNATCSFVIQSNGIATITCAAGELPAVSNKVFNKVLVANNGHWDLTDTLPSPNSDGSDNGKVPTVNGTRWEMKKAVVDDALSDTSTNPVQNKVVKAALDSKADRTEATEQAAGLMSAKDKKKLNGIEDGATNTVVDAELNANSTNPVQNKVVKEALDGKASTEVASQTANGLMSKEDKTKLDGVEDGATRVIVDDYMSGTSTNPVQNKVVKKYIDDHNFLPDPIPNGNSVQTLIVDRASRGYKLMTFDNLELPGAAESTNAPQTRSVKYLLDRKASKDAATEESDGLMSALDKTKLDDIEDGATNTVVDAELNANSTNPVQNKAVKAALDGKASTAVASQTANGLMSKDDKKKLDGVEDGATRVIVDDAMSDTSTNPVQNKAVKAALDGKLDKTGGTLTGNLRVTGALLSGDGLSFGTGENIHFTKAADDAGKLAHGAAGVDDTVPLARLKVASPTEDDDAATKAYVDNNAAGAGAVRYDAAQTLDGAQQGQARTNIGAVGHNSPQFQGFLSLAPANAPLGTGVGLSPSGSGNDFALDISDVNEGTPTLLTGVKTPTDTHTDAAATVEYVKNKISEVTASGGVDVDNALSATSTNPVQNKVITSALNGKADKSELGNKADKTALDAKADKTALDAKMDKSGGTFTGNVYGKYFCGTWLQSTAASDLGRAPGKIAVLDDSGWVYYRTPAELLADIGAMSGGDYYTKVETDAAIAVRASTSAYGTTKLSNSTTSSSKTLAATPYAVKTALAQAKAYVDSAIAVAINSAY